MLLSRKEKDKWIIRRKHKSALGVRVLAQTSDDDEGMRAIMRLISFPLPWRLGLSSLVATSQHDVSALDHCRWLCALSARHAAWFRLWSGTVLCALPLQPPNNCSPSGCRSSAACLSGPAHAGPQRSVFKACKAFFGNEAECWARRPKPIFQCTAFRLPAGRARRSSLRRRRWRLKGAHESPHSAAAAHWPTRLYRTFWWLDSLEQHPGRLGRTAASVAQLATVSGALRRHHFCPILGRSPGDPEFRGWDKGLLFFFLSLRSKILCRYRARVLKR